MLIIAELKDGTQRNYFSERMAEYRLTIMATDPANYVESQEQVDVKIGNATQTYTVWNLSNIRLRKVESFAFVGNAFVYATGNGVMADALRLRETQNNDRMLSVSALTDNFKLVEKMGTGSEDAPLSDIAVFINKQSSGSVLFGSPMTGPETYAVRFDPVGRKTFEKLVTPIKRDKAEDGEVVLLSGRLSAPSASASRFFSVNTSLFFAWSGSGRLWWNILDRLQGAPIFDLKGQYVNGRTARSELVKTRNSTLKDPYRIFDRFEGEHAIGLTWMPGQSFENNFQPVVVLEIRKDLKWDRNRVGATDGAEGFINDLIVAFVDSDKKELKYKHRRYFSSLIFSQPETAFADPETPSGLVNLLELLMSGKTSEKLGKNGEHFFPVYAIVQLTDSNSLSDSEPRTYLVGAWSSKVVEAAVRQLEMPRGLEDIADFKSNVRDLVKTSPLPRAMFYMDYKRLNDVLYYDILPNEKYSKGIIANIGPDYYNQIKDYIPSPNVIKDYFGGIGGVMTTTPDGKRLIEARSAIGILPVSTFLGFLLDDSASGETQVDVAEKRRYRLLYAALNLYATDQNAYPLYLSDLMNPKLQYLIDLELPADEENAYNNSNMTGLDHRYRIMTQRRLKLMDNPLVSGQQVTDANNFKDCDDPDKTNIIYVPNHPDTKFRREIDLYGLADQIIMYQKESTSPNGLLFFLQRDGRIGQTTATGIERRLTGMVDYHQRADDETGAVAETAKK